jgi:uncharacterized protein YbaR (Trm112 family)
MSSEAQISGKFEAQILELLACPVCLGELRLEEAGAGIVCGGCLRVYPLVDGIPVLIAERAEKAL